MSSPYFVLFGSGFQTAVHEVVFFVIDILVQVDCQNNDDYQDLLTNYDYVIYLFTILNIVTNGHSDSLNCLDT